MYEVMIEKQFSSAHFLRSYHGKDEPLHGHNWRVQVKFKGKNLDLCNRYAIANDIAKVIWSSKVTQTNHTKSAPVNIKYTFTTVENVNCMILQTDTNLANTCDWK